MNTDLKAEETLIVGEGMEAKETLFVDETATWKLVNSEELLKGGVDVPARRATPRMSVFEEFGPKHRMDDELYCDYRCRLYWENRARRAYLKGQLSTQVIWPGYKGMRRGSFA